MVKEYVQSQAGATNLNIHKLHNMFRKKKKNERSEPNRLTLFINFTTRYVVGKKQLIFRCGNIA